MQQPTREENSFITRAAVLTVYYHSTPVNLNRTIQTCTPQSLLHVPAPLLGMLQRS